MDAIKVANGGNRAARQGGFQIEITEKLQTARPMGKIRRQIIA